MTGGGGSNTHLHHDPKTITWPTLTVTATDQFTGQCYDMAGTVNDHVTADIMVHVSLSNPAGYNGPDIFFVTVRNGSNVIYNATLAPGGSGDAHFAGQSTPGGSFTFTARAWAGGSPDIQGTSNAVTLKGACQTSAQGSSPIGGGNL